MALPVPSGLSPSKVESFTSCALAFRFSAVDRLPEPPAVHTTKGTLVHRALELLFEAAPEERTRDAARAALARATAEVTTTHDWTGLALDDEAAAAVLADADLLVQRYFDLEDPSSVRAIGLELKLEAEVGGVVLRGIIDRLELDADGELVVTDYKTGRPPPEAYERGKLGGVTFYAYLCEQLFGRRPARVQLLYLSEPVALIASPSEQALRFLPKKVGAVWQAVVRACHADDFRPKPGRLCDWCSYKAWCPAFGGDPGRARAEYLGHIGPVAAGRPVQAALALP